MTAISSSTATSVLSTSTMSSSNSSSTTGFQSAYQAAISAGGAAPAWTAELINELILQNGHRDMSQHPFSPVEIGILDKAGMLPASVATTNGIQENMNTYDSLYGLGWSNLPNALTYGYDTMGAQFNTASLPNYDTNRNSLVTPQPSPVNPVTPKLPKLPDSTTTHSLYDAAILAGGPAPAWTEGLINELILQNGKRDLVSHPYSPLEIGILDKAGMLDRAIASAETFKQNAEQYDLLHGLGWSSLPGAGAFGHDTMGARFLSLINYDATRNTFGNLDAWT